MLKRVDGARFALAVLLLIVCATAAAAAARPDDPPGPGGSTPAIGNGDPAWRAGERMDESRAASRGSRGQAVERRASRTKFRDMPRAEALELARAEFPRQLRGRLFDGGRPAPGIDVTDQRGGGAAIVREEATGRRALLASTLPLQVKTPTGGLAPVDLSLVDSPAGYETRTSAAPVRVYETGAGDVALLGTGVRMRLAEADERTAMVASDRAVFANVLTDTDVGVIPQPTGAEVFLHVRSEDSPERYEFAVTLPEGAAIRRAKTPDPIPNDPPEAIEIVRGGTPVAYVYPPLAVDADGRSVASSMRLEGRRIVVAVDHRGEDLRYPLAVDPEVRVYGGSWNDWPRWWWSQYRAPASDGSVSGYYGSAKNNCAYYCPGLYQSHPTNTYITNGSYGYWYYRAPGNIFVYRVQFGGIAHSPVVIYSAHHTRGFQGIMNRAFNAWQTGVNYRNQAGGYGPNPFGPASHAYWGIEHDFCFEPRCNIGAGEEMNYAMFGLQTQNAWGCCGVQTFPEKGTTTMAWSNVYLGDRQRPWLEGTPASRSWFDDGFATHPLTVRGRDNGLGIYAIRLWGAPTGNATRYHGCTGHPDTSACPWDWSQAFSYTLNEGRNTLSIDARDAVDNYTPTHTWTLDVDRSRPVINSVSGSLYDARKRDDHRFEGLYGDAYTLSVGASDSYSGVREIEVYVGGASQRQRGGFAAGSTLNWTLRPDDYGDGEHEVKIVVRDNVAGQAGAPDDRHVATQSFTVTVDRRGDVYQATEWAGDPSAGGERVSREWTRFGEWDSRSESGGAVATRRTIQCPGSDDPNTLCGEVRHRLLEGDDDVGGPQDDFDVMIGETPDDERLEPVSDLTKHVPPGEVVETGPIAHAAEPWQTLPPAHGTTYELWRAETVTDDEDEGDPEAERVVVSTWVDQETKLPIKHDVTHQDGTGSEPIRFDYRTGRLELAELPVDHFAVSRPDDPNSDSTTEYRGSTQPQPSQPQDRETGATFTPMWMGGNPALGAESLCYASTQLYESDVDEPPPSLVPDPDPDEEPHAAGPITAVDADYRVVAADAQCTPGLRQLGDPDLTISAYAGPSTVGGQWVETYDAAVTVLLTDVAADPSRVGRETMLVGGELATVYYLPFDAEEITALADLDDTVLTIKGPFLTDVTRLNLVLAQLEAM